jgi:hypothetical protein
MRQITIEKSEVVAKQVKVVRKEFDYCWPYWKPWENRFAFYRRSEGKKSLKVVEVDGEQIGFVVPGVRYPEQILVSTGKFSNGYDWSVWENRLPVVTVPATLMMHELYHHPDHEWWQKNHGWWCPGQLGRDFLPNGVKLNFQQFCLLKPGQVVWREQPFRLELCGCRVLNNRGVSFPLKRPHGLANWNNWPRIKFARGISPENWKLFLKAILGLMMEDIVKIKDVRQRMRQVQKREHNRQRIRRVGQCFTGHKAIKRVAVGENLIFVLEKGGSQIFVVDSPEYARALYVFDDYKDAMAWASRSIGWQEARQRARLVRIHAGAWEKDIEVALG